MEVFIGGVKLILNDEQFRGLKDALEEGFNLAGIILTDREKVVLDMSVKTTLDLVSHVYGIGKQIK